jgi:hypothetical protein
MDLLAVTRIIIAHIAQLTQSVQVDIEKKEGGTTLYF